MFPVLKWCFFIVCLHVSGSPAVHSWAGVSGGHSTAREDGAVEQNCVFVSGIITRVFTCTLYSVSYVYKYSKHHKDAVWHTHSKISSHQNPVSHNYILHIMMLMTEIYDSREWRRVFCWVQEAVQVVHIRDTERLIFTSVFSVHLSTDSAAGGWQHAGVIWCVCRSCWRCRVSQVSTRLLLYSVFFININDDQ